MDKSGRSVPKRGSLERVNWGVYRVPTFPLSKFAEYMEATLWPAGAMGVISHESALAIRDLSDVNPPKIHITVPKGLRVRRAVPGHLAIHHADLSDNDVTQVEGIPATTVRRAIEDATARIWVPHSSGRRSGTAHVRGTSGPMMPAGFSGWFCHEHVAREIHGMTQPPREDDALNERHLRPGRHRRRSRRAAR